MKSKFNKSILLLGILVAILCMISTLKEGQLLHGSGIVSYTAQLDDLLSTNTYLSHHGNLKNISQ